jgi:chemotaxis protein CheD
MDVGKKNIDFIMEYIAKEGLSLKAQDVGDIYPRKVLYFPETGSVKMKKLKTDRTPEVSQQEKKYLDSMAKPKSTDVELF